MTAVGRHQASKEERPAPTSTAVWRPAVAHPDADEMGLVGSVAGEDFTRC